MRKEEEKKKRERKEKESSWLLGLHNKIEEERERERGWNLPFKLSHCSPLGASRSKKGEKSRNVYFRDRKKYAYLLYFLFFCIDS